MRGRALGALALTAALVAGGAAGAGAATPPASVDLVLATPIPGYRLVSAGPLVTARYATYAPDPAAAAAALVALQRQRGFGDEVRSWESPGGLDAVIDLVAEFPTPDEAAAFAQAQRQALAASTDTRQAATPGVPGAAHTVFATTHPTDGLGQVVTLSSGRFAATLSFLSSSDPANRAPITTAVADGVARRQLEVLEAAMRAPGSGGHTGAWIALGAGALVLAGLGVATALRRTRPPGDAGDR